MLDSAPLLPSRLVGRSPGLFFSAVFCFSDRIDIASLFGPSNREISSAAALSVLLNNSITFVPSDRPSNSVHQHRSLWIESTPRLILSPPLCSPEWIGSARLPVSLPLYGSEILRLSSQLRPSADLRADSSSDGGVPVALIAGLAAAAALALIVALALVAHRRCARRYSYVEESVDAAPSSSEMNSSSLLEAGPLTQASPLSVFGTLAAPDIWDTEVAEANGFTQP
jgi:hypothetical protein